jgi:hypothetical protein
VASLRAPPSVLWNRDSDRPCTCGCRIGGSSGLAAEIPARLTRTPRSGDIPEDWPMRPAVPESGFAFADQLLLGCQSGGTRARHLLTRAHEIGACWSDASSSQARRTDANGRLCGKSAAAQYASAATPPGHSHMTLALKRTLWPRDVPETDTAGGTLTPPTHVERIRPGKSIACGCFAIRWHTAARLGRSPPVGSQRRLNR